MSTAVNRLPRERTIPARLNDSYTALEKALAELNGINLNNLPRNHPMRAHIKAARVAAESALAQTGSALKSPPIPATIVKPRRTRQTSVQAAKAS